MTHTRTSAQHVTVPTQTARSQPERPTTPEGIAAHLARLKDLHPGVMIWHGAATRRWWAGGPFGLIDTDTPRELHEMLSALAQQQRQTIPPQRHPAVIAAPTHAMWGHHTTGP